MPVLHQSSDSKEEMLKETRGQVHLAHDLFVQTLSSARKMQALLRREESALGCQNRQDLSEESMYSHGLLQKDRDVINVHLHGAVQTSL